MKRLTCAAALALAAGSALGQTATMPPHVTPFTGATRGYWFTAPVGFRITGIQVLQAPGGANGFMNWAVVKFDGNTPPPVFATVTNAFTQLGLGLDQPANTYFPVSIDIQAGDVIGIYGNTASASGSTTGANSYGNGTLGTTILGNPVTLARSGMQFHLGSATSPNGMHDLWSEPSSTNISRVEFTYTPLGGPSGACCITATGSCIISTPTACPAAGGVYGGNNTTCATAPCTAVCYDATNLGVAIADGGVLQNGSAGPDAVATLNVAASGTISSMTAKVNISHTYQGDVRFKLVHPDGTEVVLVNRPGVVQPKQSEPPNPPIAGFGFGNDNYGSAAQSMTFKDGAPAGVYDDANGGGTAIGTDNVAGLWAPVGSLASLNGKSITGDWKLIANDYAGGDTGTINSFSICVSVAGGNSCYANCDNSTNPPCLNVNDFVCFNNAYSAGSAYANCDGSTISPVLNVNDFVCFNNKYSAGCATPCSPHP